MALIGELKPYLNEIARNLRILVKNDCGSLGATTAGVNSSIPEGMASMAVVKTNGTRTVTITMSDGTTYPLTAQGEVFSDAGGFLPEYTIASGDGGTWKWHGIK